MTLPRIALKLAIVKATCPSIYIISTRIRHGNAYYITIPTETRLTSMLQIRMRILLLGSLSLMVAEESVKGVWAMRER